MLFTNAKYICAYCEEDIEPGKEVLSPFEDVDAIYCSKDHAQWAYENKLEDSLRLCEDWYESQMLEQDND